MSRRSISLMLILILAIAAPVAWFATREEIASGTGKKGDWRVEASWGFGSYCLKRYQEAGEGGACGFAKPGTVNEAISWLVFDGDRAITLVAGPVPPGTERLTISAEDGDPIKAELTKVVRMTFFFAEVPGAQAIEEITAFDESGEVIDEYQHGSLPRPMTNFGKDLGDPP